MKTTVLGDRYELMEKIGEGGMATVYRARCRTLDRIVAVKILKEEFLNDQSFVEKFNTEALSAAQLSHPNIVNVYDVGQQEQIYYIVMEYVEGKSLNELLDEEAPLAVEMAVDIAIGICDGIHHAHSKGIIHRDIKPHNILITSDGIVKVADFGIAQAISRKTVTFGGNVVGSVHYISPEQAKGEAVGPASDIYSLGCVLYEMLTAQLPFDADSPITVALKHMYDEAVSPRSINPEIPPTLEGIIMKAMEKMPVERFASAEAMRNALLDSEGDSLAGYKRSNRNGKTMVLPAWKDQEMNEVVKKKKLRTPFLVGIIIAVLGLLGGFLSTMGAQLFPDEVAVPNIVGKDIKEAEKELSKVKLTMNVIKEFNDEYDKDKVFFQNPGPGQKVKEGREIKVKMSKGAELQKVPYLEGLKLIDAEIKLRNEGLELGKTDRIYDDKYEADLVISQDPEAGSRSKKGTKVDLMVSKGKTPEKVAMPKLLGLSLKEANNKLQENKLLPGEVKYQPNSEYYSDQVCSQEVETGVLVDEDSSIALTVSQGPGPVARVKEIEFSLPLEQDYYKVLIIVKDSQGKRQVYDELHRAGDTVYSAVKYYGSGELEIRLNGKFYKTMKI
ncbi:MAG: Stk1 family PASTA domain-containing Ser/Thr kinase [Syntrophomonas sp.]|uniref:Stk1 family PASTA domain-containing Ser/Thr kinase n=1 Tax=Syntrophomonas sp. TaxID=2053627 RepID=UPI00261EB763|nr:Stk1 family PASTA domain-containing Ser/Thr kinase [Syntrophomonas sp.]MDD2509733.1 Stk1 family PASTA domain-containing Ser/Thr kinase [Syntrophomonas sp.]MDD3879075.1 Stk1 family PASTA domain-containing Ser/Thr kinase [Syntrophomonas sp.]MDD4625865.1 Stk1 family PASTA domain-containing Ser/Thr kinase [Syntrophomonas sp.]